MAKKIKETKTYEIDSLEKLCNVINAENFTRLTTDLVLWLNYHVVVTQNLRKQFPKDTKGKSNSELGQSYFIWIDDGKHDCKEVVIKNKLTGEIKTITYK